MFSLVACAAFVLLTTIGKCEYLFNNDDDNDGYYELTGDEGDEGYDEYSSMNEDGDIYLPQKKRFPTFEYCCCYDVPTNLVCDTVYGHTYPNLCQAKCNSVNLKKLKPGKCPPPKKHTLVVAAGAEARVSRPFRGRIRIISAVRVFISFKGLNFPPPVVNTVTNFGYVSASNTLVDQVQAGVTAVAKGFAVAVRHSANQAFAHAQAAAVVVLGDRRRRRLEEEEEEWKPATTTPPPPTTTKHEGWFNQGLFNKCCCVGVENTPYCDMATGVIYPNQCQAECNNVYSAVACGKVPKVVTVKASATASLNKGVMTVTVNVFIAIEGREKKIKHASASATRPVTKFASSTQEIKAGEEAAATALAVASRSAFAQAGAAIEITV